MALASRGARESEDGTRSLLSDADDVAFFRKQARRIYAKTFFATLFLLLAGRAWLYWRP